MARSTSRGTRVDNYDEMKDLPMDMKRPADRWSGSPAFPRTPRSIPKYPDWRRKDLRRRDLRGFELRGGDFEEANISGMDLRGTDFTGSYMVAVNLENANLKDANLSGTKLNNANLSKADLEKAHILHSDLTNATLAGADLKKTELGGSILHGADFADATNIPKHMQTDWQKISEATPAYAKDMERLAKHEKALRESEADAADLDRPGKRNSLTAKLARSNARASQKDIDNLRYKWRYLLASDKDRDDPGKIAQRVGTKAPTRPRPVFPKVGTGKGQRKGEATPSFFKPPRLPRRGR